MHDHHNRRINREVFPEFFKSCPNLPPLRTPIALTQKLWQKTSYLQLSALNNWFYVVITNFAQHYLQSKIEGMTGPFAPTWLHVSQQLLMAMWFWTFSCSCKPVDNSR